MPLNTGLLVGREVELDRLSAAIGLDAAAGGLVVVSGDAGIGKSRMLAALTAAATERGWLTATGHCVGQAGSALAHLPFIELLSTLEANEPEVVETVLTSHPALGHLLPGRLPDAPAEAVSHGPVAEAVHALFTALGEARATLLVIEDVHWADHSSRNLLTLLLTRGFPSAVGLVVTYRSRRSATTPCGGSSRAWPTRPSTSPWLARSSVDPRATRSSPRSSWRARRPDRP
jgi:predicted ATPase